MGRHLRQILLADWGELGQERIARATAAVLGDGPPLAREVAALYANGAGFAGLTEGPLDAASLAPSAVVTTVAAAEVLAGARLALGVMRDVVGFGEAPR